MLLDCTFWEIGLMLSPFTPSDGNDPRRPLSPEKAAVKTSGTGALQRVLPFLLFMAFIGLDEAAVRLRDMGLISIQDSTLQALYPLRVLAAGSALWIFRSSYSELRWRELTRMRHISATIVVGITVFSLWIGIELIQGTGGNPRGFNPTGFEDPFTRWILIAGRLTGAALVVPIMEELFWRSFLIRYLVRTDFQQAPVGLFTWTSFGVTVLLFGLEHHLVIAGIIAGAAYNMLLYYTRSIAHCTLAHAITNLLLGLYVLNTGSWYFW